MKLKIQFPKETKHTDLVSCVGWVTSSELISIGDDQQVLKWSLSSSQDDDTSVVCKLPQSVYPTQMQWYPTASTKKLAGGSADFFVLGATDGKVYFMSRHGRIEKSIEGHRGAVLAVKWSADGSALITAGEDGFLKVWSKAGMLRSTLAQCGTPIYAAAWSPQADKVLYCDGCVLIAKPLQPSSKPIQWKAHDSLITAVDWSPTHELIISGSEDRKYKVWDSFGRQLYSSHLHEHPILSLAWSPDGSLFAVGSFNTLRLCDSAGWSASLEKPNSGGIFGISWAKDSTGLAAACGSGQVLFAHIVDRHLVWKHFEASITAAESITVKDVRADSKELLEVGSRIVKASIGWNYLVIVTASSGLIYSCENWNTPSMFEMKDTTVALIKQTEKHFVVANASSGIIVYSYEGRVITTIRYPGMVVEALTPKTVTVSEKTVAVRDRRDEKTILLFESLTGKPVGDGQPIKHETEVVEIALDQCGPFSNRHLAFLDAGRNLYIVPARQYGSNTKPLKIGSMVTAMAWSDSANILATIQEGHFVIYYHPAGALSDRDLLPLMVETKSDSDLGKTPQFLNYSGNRVTFRRSDGAIVFSSVSPYPVLLHRFANCGQWTDALRLCRFVKEESMWACLAAMAIAAKELQSALVAYAAIDEAAKLKYLEYIQKIPTVEGRNAELALFCHRQSQAESIFLQAGLIYRAIDMNIRLYNWERALALAVKHTTHVDTVLAYRQRYLQSFGREENNKRFLQYAETVPIDWEKIKSKIALEEEKEIHRAGRQG